MRFRLLFIFLIMTTSWSASFANDELTLKEIEGKTYLVQINDRDQVVCKFMEVVTKEKNLSFEESLRLALEEYRELLQREKDQIRFISYDSLNGEVGESASTHLADLVTHYNDTYANQIQITFGKRVGNEEILKEKEILLVSALTNLGVAASDIKVNYKWDRGPEPTAFIKVNATIRKLPSL